MNWTICWSTKKAIAIYDCHCHLSLLHNKIQVSFRRVFKIVKTKYMISCGSMSWVGRLPWQSKDGRCRAIDSMISLSIPLVISLCSLLAPFSAHLNAWNRHLTRKYSTKLSTPGQWPMNCEGCKRNQMVLEPANMHSNAHFWGLDITTKIKNRRQAEAYWKERTAVDAVCFP